MSSINASSSPASMFVPAASQEVYDLSSESDTLALLKSIHRSMLDVEMKNAMRDAIFSYRQSFGQAELTNACELFAQVGIRAIACEPGATVQKPPKKALPVSESRLGFARRQPQFVASSSTFTQSHGEKEATQTPKSTTPPRRFVGFAPPPPVEQKDTTEVQVSETPVPSPTVVVEPAASIPTSPEPTPAAVDQVETPKVPETVAVTKSQSPLDRINEIKHDINTRVGNPVNLIDAHNGLGREYMNALLDAMKKVNGGQASELDTALAQLEAVYARVLETLEKGTSAVGSEISPTPPPSVTIEPTLEPLPTPVVAQEPVNEIKLEPVPTIQVAEVTPVVNPPTPKEGIVSVAKTKQVQDLMRSQMLKEAEQADLEKHIAEDKMDPLMVSEVAAGLQQLLSEWVLFKSSGLFGTGPSGIEHPLFKKLASLPMQAVVAGRFDDATPQIRQSISDYMNGWRYEEGVVFDYGETFEHYLRRVIRHIIDKRTQSAAVKKN
jgi:hypothetical protein